jgi:hypothetical protein
VAWNCLVIAVGPARLGPETSNTQQTPGASALKIRTPPAG